MAWAAKAARDLPWRRTRDPWAVLVSEVMLQQTQVSRVVDRYCTFLDRFPTSQSCAEAPVGEVLRQWDGLGYNRRALSLHRAAVAIGDGPFPDTLDGLLALPGVGQYTARAILAFAFERDVGVLDVNASRVLSRVLGVSATQADADAAVPAGEGWGWNQAVLDLGATVCTAAVPACADCPLASECGWRRRGGPDPAVRLRRQSTFEGSDRQGRGRLVAALRRGPVAGADVPAACGWPGDADRAARVAGALLAEGLAVERGGVLSLP